VRSQILCQLVAKMGVQIIETNSFETTSFETTFIWGCVHLRPRSFEAAFIWGRVHLRPRSFETTFILRHVKVKLFWFAVDHIFMIYLPLPCNRPEFLQGDSSFVVMQGYALPYTRSLMLGCTCTCTLKHHKGQKTLDTSGLEGRIAPVKCHFLWSSKIMYYVSACFLYRGVATFSIFSWKMKNEEKMSSCIDLNSHRSKWNFVAFEKKNATAYEQNVWHVISKIAIVLAEQTKHLV